MERYVRNVAGRGRDTVEIPYRLGDKGRMVGMVQGAKVGSSDGIAPWLRFERLDTAVRSGFDCSTRKNCYS